MAKIDYQKRNKEEKARRKSQTPEEKERSKAKATYKQKEFMKKLGIKFTSQMKKITASRLIEKELNRRKKSSMTQDRELIGHCLKRQS